MPALQISALPEHPDDAGKRPLVFRDWVEAVRHICDHVLSHQESCGWALLAPGERAELELRAVRLAAAREAWTEGTDGERIQELYDGYAREIRTAVEAGRRLGWYWSQTWLDRSNSVRHYFGPHGVEVVLSRDLILSAMLPGFGEPLRVEAQRALVQAGGDGPEARRRNPLPRDDGRETPFGRLPARGMIRFRELDEDERRRRRRMREEDAGHSFEEALYRLFRRCAEFVRRERLDDFVATLPQEEAATGLSYATSDFATWKRLRSEVLT